MHATGQGGLCGGQQESKRLWIKLQQTRPFCIGYCCCCCVVCAVGTFSVREITAQQYHVKLKISQKSKQTANRILKMRRREDRKWKITIMSVRIRAGKVYGSRVLEEEVNVSFTYTHQKINWNIRLNKQTKSKIWKQTHRSLMEITLIRKKNTTPAAHRNASIHISTNIWAL